MFCGIKRAISNTLLGTSCLGADLVLDGQRELGRHWLAISFVIASVTPWIEATWLPPGGCAWYDAELSQFVTVQWGKDRPKFWSLATSIEVNDLGGLNKAMAS